MGDAMTTRQVTRRTFVTLLGGVTAGLAAACAAQPPATSPTAAPMQPAKPAPAATAAPAKPAEAPKPAAAAPTTAPIVPATSAPASTGGQAGGKATWAISGDPTCLAPFGILPGLAHEGKEMLYDSLVQWDRDLRVQPALAAEWSNPDDKTYLFKLRPGVKFHNGKEVDAEDVKYSLELQGKPPQPGAPIPQYPQIESVEAVDGRTVKLTMKGPDPTVLGWFAWTRWSGITSKGFYEGGNPCTTANGTGPFKLVEYVGNDRVVMTRHADFWKAGTPYLDELTLKVLPDESSRLAALRSGQIEGTDLTPDTALSLRNDPNIAILKGVTSTPRVLQFTIKGDGKPWNDKRVRRAMSMAIDRQDLIDKVYGGEAEWTGPIPPGAGEWPLPDAKVKDLLKFDPEGARTLLAEAGYKDGFPIQINTTSSLPDFQACALVVKDHLRRVGIEVNVVTEEIAIFAKHYNEGTFEWLLNGRGMRHDPTGYVNEFGNVHAAQAKLWFDDGKGWENPEITSLFQAVSVNLDQRARVPQIHRIQELALEEAPHVFLAQPYKFTAVRKNVKDMYVSFTDFRPGLRDVWLEK